MNLKELTPQLNDAEHPLTICPDFMETVADSNIAIVHVHNENGMDTVGVEGSIIDTFNLPESGVFTVGSATITATKNPQGTWSLTSSSEFESFNIRKEVKNSCQAIVIKI